MTLNYLGKYDNLSLLWEAHPNGGIEGEYCYVGDQLLVWDKYENNWVEGSAEALDVVPSEQPERESNNGLNCIGCFESEQQLWSQHPQGGVEGDYVVIAGKEYIWDKYNKEWREATEEDAVHFTAVIVQDETYEYSRLAITFMGSFEDVSQIWKVYPQGGIEGGYIYLGEDKYIWDKYSYSWKPFEPTESSKLRPIDVTYSEGVVAYSEDYINYIGAFDNLDQVWEMYPNGGKDGDYILVNGERLKWNKYTSNWGEDESGDTSPARSVATIYGDLHVFNDLVIGENLYARILEELSKKQWVQDNFTTKQWLLDQNYARQEWVLGQYEVLQDWVDQRNADIAKWILERNYISEGDISSETVMNLIETDEITITKKDGVLVAIASGGQGSVPIITTKDVDAIPSDRNVFSAAKVVATFLDTTKGGTVLEPVNFEKGIRIGGKDGIDIIYDIENKALCFGGNAYSLGGITAGGVGSGGSGGGGASYDRLDAWSDYSADKSGWVLSALLGNDLNTRLISVENAGYVTASYLAPYALRSEIPSLEGYATLDALNTLSQTVVNFKSLFDSMFEKDSEGNIHAKLSLWSSGGITAGGVGSGGSGGGGVSYDRLDSWADYSADKAGYVLSALLGKDLDNRVSALANAGYVTASALAPYALRSEIPSLVGYATESWVNTALAGYLPLSGGTLTDALTVKGSGSPLTVHRTQPLASVVKFVNTDGNLGWLGVDIDKTAIFMEASGVIKKLLHSGNYTDYALSVNGGTVNGSVYMNGYFRLGNSQPIMVADTNGVYQSALYLSTGNNFLIGYGTSVVGKRRTLLFGNIIEFKSNGGEDNTLVLNADRTATFSSTVSAPSFIGNLTGNADSATCLRSYFVTRPTSANQTITGKGRLFKMLATSSMTDGKPDGDGHIIHSEWDITNGYDAQLFLPNNTFQGHHPQWRAHNGGSWGEWITMIDSGNISSFNAGSATKLATARTIWGQSFDGTQNVAGNLTNVNRIRFSEAGAQIYVRGSNYSSGMTDNDIGIFATMTAFSGKVAIGGVAADEKLHVHGNGKFTGALSSPAITTNTLKVGNVTLVEENGALKVIGGFIATGGVTSGEKAS